LRPILSGGAVSPQTLSARNVTKVGEGTKYKENGAESLVPRRLGSFVLIDDSGCWILATSTPQRSRPE